MKQLPSFLQDTKHLLQIIDEINQKILDEEVSLDGVALVTLDVESMYNIMPEELAKGASKGYLERGREGDRESLKVKTQSILDALDLCLRSNYFKFNDEIYQQIGGIGTGIKLAPHMHAWDLENWNQKLSVQIFSYWRKSNFGKELLTTF